MRMLAVAKRSREETLAKLTKEWRELIEPIPGMTPSKAATLVGVSSKYTLDLMKGYVEKPSDQIVAALKHVLGSCPTCHQPWPKKESRNGPTAGQRRGASKG